MQKTYNDRCAPVSRSNMKEVAEFTVKVYSTKEKKRLKKGSKTYAYGTISIRDPRLTEFVGKQLVVKAFTVTDSAASPETERKKDRQTKGEPS